MCKLRGYHQALENEFLPWQRMVSPYEARNILEVITITWLEAWHTHQRKKLVISSQTKLYHKGKYIISNEYF